MTSDEHQELTQALEKHRAETKVGFAEVDRRFEEFRGEVRAGFAEFRAGMRGQFKSAASIDDT